MTLTTAAPRPARPHPLRRRVAEPADQLRRWPLRRLFAVGAGVTVLLTAMVIGFGAVAVTRLSDARSNLIDVATPARLAGQDLTVALLNQETGIRGFGLSGRAEFLGPYRDDLAAQQDATTTLRSLAGRTDLGTLVADVDEVERAVQAWRDEFVEPMVAGGEPAPALAPVDPERGRALFEQVRAAQGGLVANLLAQQTSARERVDSAARFLAVVGISIAAVLAGFLLAVGVWLRRAVLAPMSALAGQVRQVVSGDTHHQVRAGGPREIVELGEDVDAMRVHILRELDSAQQVNHRLDEQARDLERSNSDLEQFAYVASHDLQEPLRKVSSFCQLLARRYGGQLDERADQYIEFAVDGAQRMQRLINDLLAFSRVGRTTAGFSRVELDEVVASAVSQLDAARADADGEIVVTELPAVHGDAALLRQLFVNLIGNAWKFRRDGVPARVRVTARPGSAPDDPGGWEIAVADNGIGIEPEYADKVFVIFQRLHGRDLYPGTGIGLALAKKIVEFHRGRIWLGPGPDGGPGTTVRFTLPAAASVANPAAAPAANPEDEERHRV